MTKFLRHLIVYVHTLRHGSSKSEMQQKMNWSRPKSKLSNRILLSWLTIGILAKKKFQQFTFTYTWSIQNLVYNYRIWYDLSSRKKFTQIQTISRFFWRFWSQSACVEFGEKKKYSMILEMHFWLCTFIFLKVKWVAKYMIQEVLK